jgi:hypothetical protein
MACKLHVLTEPAIFFCLLFQQRSSCSTKDIPAHVCSYIPQKKTNKSGAEVSKAHTAQPSVQQSQVEHHACLVSSTMVLNRMLLHACIFHTDARLLRHNRMPAK